MGQKSAITVALAGLAFTLAATSAGAQGRLKLQEYNFDTWCQEEQNLPPARCDKRLPQDDAAFHAFVDKMEQYETQDLNRKARERNLDRTLSTDPTVNQTDPAANQPIRTPQ